jgi:hypothetical protein
MLRNSYSASLVKDKIIRRARNVTNNRDKKKIIRMFCSQQTAVLLATPQRKQASHCPVHGSRMDDVIGTVRNCRKLVSLI